MRLITIPLAAVLLTGCVTVKTQPDPRPFEPWTVTGVRVNGQAAAIEFAVTYLDPVGHESTTSATLGLSGNAFDSKMAKCLATATVGKPLPDCARTLLTTLAAP